MAKAEHLVDWVFDAIETLGEDADFVKVAEEIWHRHESERRESGELFFIWQTIVRRVAPWLDDPERSRPGRRRFDAAEFFVRGSLHLAKKKGVSHDAAEHDLRLIKSINRQMVRDVT